MGRNKRPRGNYFCTDREGNLKLSVEPEWLNDSIGGFGSRNLSDELNEAPPVLFCLSRAQRTQFFLRESRDTFFGRAMVADGTPGVHNVV